MCDVKLFDEADGKKKLKPAWMAHQIQPTGSGLEASGQIPTLCEASESSQSASRSDASLNIKHGKHRDVPETVDGVDSSKMEGGRSVVLLPSHAQNQCFLVQDLQNCPNVLEIKPISTTMDRVDGLESGCNNIPQTTHSLLVTNGVQRNLLQENGRFGVRIGVRVGVELHSLTSSGVSKQGNDKNPESIGNLKSTETENVMTVDNFPKLGEYRNESVAIDDAVCSAEQEPPEFVHDGSLILPVHGPKSTSTYVCTASCICTEEAENRRTKRLKLNPVTTKGRNQVYPPRIKGNKSLLSNPWIRRWLGNKSYNDVNIIQNSRLEALLPGHWSERLCSTSNHVVFRRKARSHFWYAPAF